MPQSIDLFADAAGRRAVPFDLFAKLVGARLGFAQGFLKQSESLVGQFPRVSHFADTASLQRQASVTGFGSRRTGINSRFDIKVVAYFTREIRSIA
ncbi:MAG: hypothetical protein LOD94_09885 [Gammaproteobacteria bacterium]